VISSTVRSLMRLRRLGKRPAGCPHDTDEDQIFVLIGAVGLMSAKLAKNSSLKVYQGLPHRTK
jgi:hypothetical protein